MKLSLKQKISLISVSVIMGIYLIYYIFTKIPFANVWSLLLEASPYAVWLFIGVSFLIMLLHTLRWQLIISSFGKNVPLRHIFLYKIVGFGVSFLTPVAKVGGGPLRAALLQKKGLSFKKSFSTVLIDSIIEVSTTGFLFALAVVVAIFTYALPKNMLLLLLFLSFFLVISIIYFYYQMLNDKNLFLKLFKFFRLHKIKYFQGMEQSIIEFERLLVDFHKKQTKTFYKSLFLSFFAWLLMFVEYQAVLWIFGIEFVSFQALFLIITMMGAAYLFPIPLALGVLEAGQISIFTALHLNVAAAVGLAMMIRARDFFWSIFAIILLAFYGFNFKSIYKKTLESDDVSILKK